MIYLNGNLLSVKNGIIAHGCNAQGVMGSGVAKQIADTYPDALIQYKADVSKWVDESLIRSRAHLLGRVSLWSNSDNFAIASMITQENYGKDGRKYVSYDAMDAAFASLAKAAASVNMSINIPLIGAGLGGGNWKIIESIIEAHTDDLGVEVICWEM